MTRLRAAGFTLIELLVVIGILSLLVVTFAPDLIAAWGTANQAADAKQLDKHFYWINTYKTRFGTYPEGGGHQFILGTWTKGIVEHTPQNLDVYFTPGVRETDDYYLQLKQQDPETIWQAGNITSLDTHYAGRASQFKRGMDSGKEAWMANDNEGGLAFKDGTINVLYGDGVVRPLLAERELKELGYVLSAENPFEVGPNSPHPDLKKLEK